MRSLERKRHRSTLFKCLLFHLRALRRSNDICSREEVEQLEYPEANVTLNESAKNR